MQSRYLKQLYNSHISTGLHNLAQTLPKLYLLFIISLALFGYLFLLSFPLLFIFSVGKLYSMHTELLNNPTDTMNLIWLSLFAISTIISFRIFTFRFPTIHGVRLRKQKLPTLFTMLESIQQETKHFELDRVLVTDKFELEVIKTPSFGVPFWATNTLVIGLPFLQSLSATHFRCALTRKLIQFSNFENRTTNWIYQLRQIWQDYLHQLKKGCAFGEQPLYWFFSLYTPLFRSVSISAAQKDELSADKHVLEVINNDDVFKTIESIIISKIFLNKQYWPKVRTIFKQDPNATVLPYSKLERIIKTALLQNDIKQWLEMNYEMNSSPIDTSPTLKSRMDMLGRTKIKIPSTPDESAAMVYLENAYKEVVRRIDEKWLKKQRRRIKFQSINKTDHSLKKLFYRPFKSNNNLAPDSVFN